MLKRYALPIQKIKIFFIFLQFFIFLIFICPSYPLQAFTSSEGAFSIKMPGKPKLQQVNHKSLVGNVKENTYTLKTSAEEWSVSYTQLPKIAISLEGDQALLNKAKEAFIKDTGAQELGFEKITLQGKEGRELNFQIAPQNGRSAKAGKARFILSDQKIYVIVGTSSKSETNSKRIENFINSFKLLPQKK